MKNYRTIILLGLGLLAIITAFSPRSVLAEDNCIDTSIKGVTLFEEGDLKPGDDITKTVTVKNISPEEYDLDVDIGIYLQSSGIPFFGGASLAEQEELLDQIIITITPSGAADPLPGFDHVPFSNLIADPGNGHHLDTLEYDESVVYQLRLQFPAEISDPKWQKRRADFSLFIESGCLPADPGDVEGIWISKEEGPLSEMLGALATLPQTGAIGMLAFAIAFLLPPLLSHRLHRKITS